MRKMIVVALLFLTTMATGRDAAAEFVSGKQTPRTSRWSYVNNPGGHTAVFLHAKSSLPWKMRQVSIVTAKDGSRTIQKKRPNGEIRTKCSMRAG